MSELEIGGRLFIAAILGGFIGLERESHGRPAGLRTHVLVSLGSCLIMLISLYGFSKSGLRYDPGRMAAQVISGIGFLGAGTILREGISVRGLTTAASLWCVSGIGLAIGCGYYSAASIATILAVITLVLLEFFEKKFLSPKTTTIEVTMQNKPGELAKICQALGDLGINIQNIDVEINEDKHLAQIVLMVDKKNYSKEIIVKSLGSAEGIIHLHCK
jgi:putative Mg2+ transporter-C (MgtC) family protein